MMLSVPTISSSVAVNTALPVPRIVTSLLVSYDRSAWPRKHRGYCIRHRRADSARQVEARPRRAAGTAEERVAALRDVDERARAALLERVHERRDEAGPRQPLLLRLLSPERDHARHERRRGARAADERDRL